MPVVGRLNQYASMLAYEFDETTANGPTITGLGTYYASEFSENVGIATTMTANVFSPYDVVYDEFAGVLYGPGQGRYMRQNTDKSVIVYNEIDEIGFTPSYRIFSSATSVNEGSSVTFTANANNVETGTTLYYDITGSVGIASIDFTNNSLSGSLVISGSFDLGFGSTTLTLANDVTTEGTETFNMNLRTGSISGTIIGTSSTITINDTSIPSATVTPSTSSLNEGSGVTFNVTSNQLSTTLYWTLSTISGTINTSDFAGAAVSGSFSTDGTGAGSVALTLANDTTTEGTESFQLQVRTGSTSGTIIGTSVTVTINDTSVAVGYTVVSGTKAPTLGASPAGTYPPTGWTGQQNAHADDANITIALPFNFTINSTTFTQAFASSNSYLTFGTSSTNFNTLSASNPAIPKIMFGAGDNSYQRVSTLTSGTDYVRIRQEGHNTSSGVAPGSSNLIFEITIFNPTKFTGGSNVIELLVGNWTANASQNVSNVSNASTAYTTFTMAANQSFVFVGNSTGTSWTVTSGNFVSGTGY